MKSKLFLLLISMMFSVSMFAQKSVAVYVTPGEGVSKETNKIIGSELVAAITRNENYVAIERTEDFLSQVSQEQGNYENIDNDKLCYFGKKFGASNVCVADITKFGDEYYIVARLLDINTAKVWKTSRKTSTLNSLSELVSVSEYLADDLFGNKKEFSTYAYGDNSGNQSFISKIENGENVTKVTFKYVSNSPTQRIGIQSTTYIVDLLTQEKYGLVDASNINIMDQNNKSYKDIGEGIWEYILFFERLSDDTKNIMIIEPGGWEYKDIVLKPYGNDNLFVFEDNAQKMYDELLKEQEELYSKKELSTYTYGDNSGNHSFITRIENTDTHTKVTIKYFSVFETDQIGISRETYIVDMTSNRYYRLKETSNINITSDLSSVADNDRKMTGIKGVYEFTLFFEKIPDNVRNIKIIEKFAGNKVGWVYKDISLKPYGQKGLFVFKYDDEQTIKEEYNKFLNTLVYKINFTNRKYDAQRIYVNGKYAGKVAANSNKTFSISIYEFGQVKAVQDEGWILYPDEVTWTLNNNQRPYKGQEFNIVYQ